jgi:hypothetical protein
MSERNNVRRLDDDSTRTCYGPGLGIPMASVFFSYAHKDQDLRDHLEEHLATLKRQGLIESWHDRKIAAGDRFDHKIAKELERASIVLLLVSSSFLASEYCNEVELARALERHRSGEARVIPVILRPCDWRASEFGKLKALPTDGRPVVLWGNVDAAFDDVVQAIRSIVEALPAVPPERAAVRGAVAKSKRRRSPNSSAAEDAARSSNLRINKAFSDHDRDVFLHESFVFLSSFFENSIVELKSRESSIEANFRTIDANRFTASVYRNGASQARCSISLVTEGPMGHGIQYSADASGHGYNESLQVDADDYDLFLRSLGMFSVGSSRGREAKLTQRDAAELYWQKFIEPLQRSTR